MVIFHSFLLVCQRVMVVTIHVDHPPNIGGRSASLQKPCARRHGRDHRTPAQRRRPKCFWATAGGSGNEKGPVMLRLVKFITKRVQKRGPLMVKKYKKLVQLFWFNFIFWWFYSGEPQKESFPSIFIHFPYLHLRFSW